MTPDVQRALEQLESNGRFTPDDVVQAAEDEDSPLHPHFEWDDKICGVEYRREQARTLIRSYRIEYTVSEHRVVTIPRYIRDPRAAEGEQGYVSVIRLRTDPELAREAVIAEFGRAAAALQRAQNLALALNIGDRIEDVRQQVLRLSREVQESGSELGAPPQ